MNGRARAPEIFEAEKVGMGQGRLGRGGNALAFFNSSKPAVGGLSMSEKVFSKGATYPGPFCARFFRDGVPAFEGISFLQKRDFPFVGDECFKNTRDKSTFSWGPLLRRFGGFAAWFCLGRPNL